MKYILMGYGKMGKTIEKTLKTEGNQLIATIDNHDELTGKEDYLQCRTGQANDGQRYPECQVPA